MFRHDPYRLDVLEFSCRLYTTPPEKCCSPMGSYTSEDGHMGATMSADSCLESVSSEPSVSPARTETVLIPNTDAVANHYKTRICKTFQKTGACSYEGYCRFAHGAADLHTYAQNVRAGLVSETAIREHQHALARAQKAKTAKKKRSNRKK